MEQLLQSLQTNIPAFQFFEIFFPLILDFFFWLALLTTVSLVIYLAARLFFTVRALKAKHTFLEVKPPKDSQQSSFSTQQLFNTLHAIGSQLSFAERLLGIQKLFSLEIVSSKEEGIRYLIRTKPEDADLIKKSLMSYLPGINIKRSSDYLPALNSNVSISEFSLANHFAYPLKAHETLDKNDPVAYLTGSMTQLNQNELMSFQLVVSPISKSSKGDIKRISNLIYAKKDLLSGIKSNNKQKSLALFTTLLMQILLLPLGMAIFVLSNGEQGPLLDLPFSSTKDKTSNPYQNEVEQLVKNKFDQPLFNTSIRLLIQSSSKSERHQRRRSFSSALSSVSNSGYQSLVVLLKTRLKLVCRLKQLLFIHRMHLPVKSSILSTSEVSDLYHFPFSTTTKTEDMQKEYSKELPTPVSLKKAQNLDVVFAENNYGGKTTQIGLTQDERRRHMYILGATGTGKSTMLLSMINSDLQNNKGVAVIDPHGDLIDQILHIIPEERINDVVYFNPDDIAYPMGINVLELSEGLTGDDALREKEFITESVISLFHKVYTEKYSGPRLEYILRNTIHTAFTVPGATLFTVNKLLVNPKFRKSVVKKLTDENLKEFWKFEFAKAGDYQKVKMVLPITNKIGRFLFSPTAKRILEQEKSTINFDDIMNEGKILLCNLSKGKIGEDNSKVFGSVMMAKLQLTAMKRARIPSEQRNDFYLYVDEFQNFASPSFAQILSEARKYRLNAVLAHQTTSQLEDKSLVNVTLANTGTVICFRTANPEDEKLILPQFRPYIEPGEIASLPSYRFYMRLGALNPEEPFSGITVPIVISEKNTLPKKIIEQSRNLFAVKYVKPNLNTTTKSITKKQIRKAKQSTSIFKVLP